MKKYFATASLAVSLVLGLSSGAHAQALTPIKISYQPSLYWALPFHVATEKGWWKEVGLAPEFSTFPAGVPQIAASASSEELAQGLVRNSVEVGDHEPLLALRILAERHGAGDFGEHAGILR